MIANKLGKSLDLALISIVVSWSFAPLYLLSTYIAEQSREHASIIGQV